MESVRSTVYKLLPLFVFTLVLSCIGVSAQQADDAHLFIFNQLEGSEPAIDVRLDGKPLAQVVQTIDPIIERSAAPGEYSLTITESDLSADAPLFDPIQATLEAGKLYVVAIGGTLPASTGDAWFTLVPLGQPPAPGEMMPGRVVVANRVEGLPALDLALDGTVVAADVGSNETAINDAPMDAYSEAAWSDSQAGDVILKQEGILGAETPSPLWENTVTVLILHGKYPGEAHETYDSLLLPPIYVGEVTTTDGAEIHVGDEVTLEVKAGQRIRYPLTLDAATTLDIRLLGASDVEDAFLRLYDAAGNLLDDNDELSYSDDVYDAGLTELTLQAGAYLVEAASWGDVFPGSFTLIVR